MKVCESVYVFAAFPDLIQQYSTGAYRGSGLLHAHKLSTSEGWEVCGRVRSNV